MRLIDDCTIFKNSFSKTVFAVGSICTFTLSVSLSTLTLQSLRINPTKLLSQKTKICFDILINSTLNFLTINLEENS